MSNGRIRISFMEDYPFANGNCSRIPHFRVGSSCPMPGMAVEIIALLTNYLNLTVDVAKVGPHVKRWIYTFDEVYNNETDVYALFFSENAPPYTIKYDYTKEIYSVNIKVVVRRTDHWLKGVFDFFNMYRLNAWISMIVVFLLFTTFGMFVRYIECQLTLRERCNFTEVLWKMARSQLVQSQGIDYNLVAGRSSLLIFSIFQVCIILGLFQGLILTSVVKKVNLTPFTINDFPQLVMEKKLTVVVKSDYNSWIREEIETNYELRKAITSNPYKIVEEEMRTINEGNGAVTLIDEHTWYKYWAESYCNLVLVDGSIRTRSQRFMFKKGSRFVPMFNEAIDVNKYLIKRIVRKYMKYRPPSKCIMQKTGPIPLSMTPYYGLLIMFFVGMSSACFVFSGELLKWKMSRALMSDGGATIEGNLATTAVDAPMDSKQSMLPAVGGDRNPLTLTALRAEVVATIVAAIGLPPGTKLYALTFKISNRKISYRVRN